LAYNGEKCAGSTLTLVQGVLCKELLW